ncbi:EscN/YscN/HrcN family type III secretion system ATPase [Xanthomonas citri pv. fuscans CFBP 6996]|uniref:type III secretion system ATPase SctN n=1 Tax=Xanthomonas citri TaxID=346 RepID=UPI000C191200|nr:type III secretion system ATPase SctN [Xanthomonas citri]ATS50193.1 type III secretion system ATPase SctN [Xanthomonas citri pv. phaseoli var. fuscans]ATS55928.1 type III secretion system ATPase SctN [Xanthomonas citri pv. phaseoli var. fuscans]ATS60057.1 type III secretion system ATPase SctN [Xanthomonas citri pv. phaseoli var. fuscans]PTY30871.1 EscN/YscN/HrcN family type III secretion system ATPase [Xanthomonas citri pv. fuscans CFBP 6996]QWN14808.1 EscN/YscN/HrcN family type III secreti
MLAETPLLETTLERELATLAFGRRYGKVVEVVGTMLKVAGVQVSLGEVCELRQRDGTLLQRAEVVGFSRDLALLAPFGELVGLSRETRVIGLGRPLTVPVGPALLGRVLDGLGEPSDGQGAIACDTWVPIQAQAPDPMRRRLIEQPMPTGVRIVDGLMTLGEGQRMGIFAAAGVGKSTLMGMFARGTQCDVNVIVLIGERGREVREFIELILGADGLARSVVVCATSDRSSIERAKAAYVGTAIAEYFRDRGLRVLLMMDSLTRFARAQREIGLAAGEPPTRRGFPPSVFAELPRLLERAGMGENGSITAFYTVLAEDDTGSDPIAEEVRGILDGHLILSREIAAKNQYPAIDVLASLSRVMSQIVPSDHSQAAGQLRRLLAKYNEVETLVQVGEYRQGSDAVADEAIDRIDAIRDFLSQPTDQLSAYDSTLEQLASVTDDA